MANDPPVQVDDVDAHRAGLGQRKREARLIPERVRRYRANARDERRVRVASRRRVRRTGADEEHGVDAGLLLVEREPNVEIGKRPAAQDEAAVEVLHRAPTHREIEHHLLLNRELAADPVRPRTDEGDAGVGLRRRPVHVEDVVVRKQRIEVAQPELEGPLHPVGEDGAETGTEAARLELAVALERVGSREVRLGQGRGGREHRQQGEGECERGLHGGTSEAADGATPAPSAPPVNRST